MDTHFHVVVWIDHQQAKLFAVNMDHADGVVLHSTHPHQHLHHNAANSGNAPVDATFLERVSTALATAGAILITGPASAKNELIAHIKAKHPDLSKKISGVEALDHPTDGELVALARRFFKADDRMHGSIPFN